MVFLGQAVRNYSIQIYTWHGILNCFWIHAIKEPIYLKQLQKKRWESWTITWNPLYFQNFYLCDFAHFITLDINLSRTWINCCTAYHTTDATQNTLKCKYTRVNKCFKQKNKYVFWYMIPFTLAAIHQCSRGTYIPQCRTILTTEEAGPFKMFISSPKKTWWHIHKTVFCIFSAMRTSYLTSKTKVHVPILLYNMQSWAYPVYKILLELCKNNSYIKHAQWHNLSIIYSFYMLHTNNKLQPNF